MLKWTLPAWVAHTEKTSLVPHAPQIKIYNAGADAGSDKVA